MQRIIGTQVRDEYFVTRKERELPMSRYWLDEDVAEAIDLITRIRIQIAVDIYGNKRLFGIFYYTLERA